MFKIKRRPSRIVKIGTLKIGSGCPIAVQSMVKTKAADVEASLAQIRRLQDAGCDIVRIAVEDKEDALAIRGLKRFCRLPLVADIHFNYLLALGAIEAGADKIRLNPGNIYRACEVEAVIAAARQARVPIRIGANSGSLKVRAKDTARGLVDSVRRYLRFFEKAGFHNLVISLKGSGVPDTIAAYEKMGRICDYPLHVGITATGLPLCGAVKSAAGLGVLLFKGIGDTIRVSLLGKLEEEVKTARILLDTFGLGSARGRSFELICCPTCGRCQVDLLKIAENFEQRLSRLSLKEKARLAGRKIALMGCVVNGPGEAAGADLGVAFSRHKAAVFSRGRIVSTAGLREAPEILFRLIERWHM